MTTIRFSSIAKDSTVEEIENALKNKNIASQANLISELVIHGEIEKFELLFNDGRFNIDHDSLIRTACEYGSDEILKILLESGVELSEKRLYKSFQFAILKNNPNCVKILLEDGRVDPIQNDNYFLTAAVLEGFDKPLHHLLKDERIDPNSIIEERFIYEGLSYKHLFSFFEIAALDGYVDCVKEFLKCERFDLSKFKKYIDFYLEEGKISQGIYNVILQHERKEKLNKLFKGDNMY